MVPILGARIAQAAESLNRDMIRRRPPRGRTALPLILLKPNLTNLRSASGPWMSCVATVNAKPCGLKFAARRTYGPVPSSPVWLA